MLVKNKSMFIPISIEFRKCLIQETIFQLKITIDQIQNVFKNKSSNAKDSQNSSETDLQGNLLPKEEKIDFKVLEKIKEPQLIKPEGDKVKNSDYNITMSTVKKNLIKKDEEKDLLENK